MLYTLLVLNQQGGVEYIHMPGDSVHEAFIFANDRHYTLLAAFEGEVAPVFTMNPAVTPEEARAQRLKA